MKISLEDLIRAVPKAWSPDTVAKDKSPRQASSTHPAAGQAITSSLLVKRHLGGDIIQCQVGGETWSRIVHYFNELENGVTIDLTRSQFTGVNRRKPHRLFVKNPKESYYILPGDMNTLSTMDKVDLLENRVLEVLSWDSLPQ